MHALVPLSVYPNSFMSIALMLQMEGMSDKVFFFFSCFLSYSPYQIVYDTYLSPTIKKEKESRKRIARHKEKGRRRIIMMLVTMMTY
jgi:hypothetical protein